MTHAMTRMIAVCAVLAGLAGAAQAQAAGSGGEPAAAAVAPAPAGGLSNPAEVRAACTALMNSDKAFAADIVKIADQKAALQRDADTVAAHTDANRRVQQNEKHVIWAYAAMWIIAAGFVVFLWRRQQALKDEILQLRRDLEAAAGDAKAAP